MEKDAWAHCNKCVAFNVRAAVESHANHSYCCSPPLPPRSLDHLYTAHVVANVSRACFHAAYSRGDEILLPAGAQVTNSERSSPSAVLPVSRRGAGLSRIGHCDTATPSIRQTSQSPTQSLLREHDFHTLTSVRARHRDHGRSTTAQQWRSTSQAGPLVAAIARHMGCRPDCTVPTHSVHQAHERTQ